MSQKEEIMVSKILTTWIAILLVVFSQGVVWWLTSSVIGLPMNSSILLTGIWSSGITLYAVYRLVKLWRKP